VRQVEYDRSEDGRRVRGQDRRGSHAKARFISSSARHQSNAAPILAANPTLANAGSRQDVRLFIEHLRGAMRSPRAPRGHRLALRLPQAYLPKIKFILKKDRSVAKIP